MLKYFLAMAVSHRAANTHYTHEIDINFIILGDKFSHSNFAVAFPFFELRQGAACSELFMDCHQILLNPVQQ